MTTIDAVAFDDCPLLPFEDRVVIALDPLTERRGVGGLLLPPPPAQTRGTVVAVGPGRYADDGSRVPMALQPGDRVEIPNVGGTDVDVDGVEYHLIPERLILSRITDPF